MNPFKDILVVLVTLCLIKSGEECVVFVVRVVAKAQRQDQEVCALCLESLCHLVPLLQSKDDMVTRCVSESRNDALILLSAFLWVATIWLDKYLFFKHTQIYMHMY